MSEEATITLVLTPNYQRFLADGRVITLNHAYEYEGVWMRVWADTEGNLLEKMDFTYEEYEQYRQAHPELDLPEIRPREPGTGAPGTGGDGTEGEGTGGGAGANGNTTGKVVGEQAPAGVPAAEANPAVQPETDAEAAFHEKVLDGVQIGLDVVGLIPGVGEIADGTNAVISAFRGDWVGAGLSVAAMIPFAGWFATGAKGIKRGAHAVEAGTKIVERAGKEVLEEGLERAGKEVVEEGLEHAGKEAVEEGAEQAGKHGNEAVEAAEDGGKVDKKKKKKKNDQLCKSLRRRIVNSTAELIGKRSFGLETNPGKLPLYDPYRTKPHAQDVLGHLLKFRLQQNELKATMKLYEAKNCGPLPPGAEAAATMDPPALPPLPPNPPQVKPNLPP